MSSVPPDFEEGYAELRSLAARYFRRHDQSHTLQATALVHEVFLKLLRDGRQYVDRAHFLCTAATAMKQILCDHARSRYRDKRGGGWARVTIDRVDLASAHPVDVLVLDDALSRLSALDPRQAQIVELRCFVGLSVEDVAEVLGISERTVKRDWAMARAWLQRELGPPAT